MGAALVILGTGEEVFHKALSAAREKFPGSLGLRIAYDESLSHKIYAGSDVFLIPSRYEPCGLTQMYSLRYGTIPVVRATGGLDDTIQEYDPERGTGNGFKFQEYSSAALLGSLEKALKIYRKKDGWRDLMQKAMACDFSWRCRPRIPAPLSKNFRVLKEEDNEEEIPLFAGIARPPRPARFLEDRRSYGLGLWLGNRSLSALAQQPSAPPPGQKRTSRTPFGCPGPNILCPDSSRPSGRSPGCRRRSGRQARLPGRLPHGRKGLGGLTKKSGKDSCGLFFSRDDVVGIKVNPVGPGTISTHLDVVDALIDWLVAGGLNRKNIIIWDRFDYMLRDAGSPRRGTREWE